MKYTLGILDEEQTQIDLISECFKNSFNIVKIDYVEEVDDLIDIIKSEKVDIISIDYKLKDHNSSMQFNGDYFFKELIDKFDGFPAFVLTQDVSSAKNESKKISPRFIVDKTVIHNFLDPKNSQSKEDFIKELILEIEVHKDKIKEEIDELRKLEAILESKEKLDEDKENRYIELNNKLAKSISGYSSLPQKYFSQDTNSRIDLLINKTEELLKKLS